MCAFVHLLILCDLCSCMAVYLGAALHPWVVVLCIQHTVERCYSRYFCCFVLSCKQSFIICVRFDARSHVHVSVELVCVCMLRRV